MKSLIGYIKNGVKDSIQDIYNSDNTIYNNCLKLYTAYRKCESLNDISALCQQVYKDLQEYGVSIENDYPAQFLRAFVGNNDLKDKHYAKLIDRKFYEMLDEITKGLEEGN